MAEMVRFVVTIPKTELEDLALQEGLGEVATAEQLAQVVKDAVIAGLEEYLGEVNSGLIDVKPIR